MEHLLGALYKRRFMLTIMAGAVLGMLYVVVAISSPATSASQAVTQRICAGERARFMEWKHFILVTHSAECAP